MSPKLTSCSVLGMGMEMRLLNIQAPPPAPKDAAWRGDGQLAIIGASASLRSANVVMKGKSTDVMMHPMLALGAQPAFSANVIAYTSTAAMKKDIAGRVSRSSSSIPVIGSLLDGIAGSASMDAQVADTFGATQEYLYMVKRQQEMMLSLAGLASNVAPYVSLNDNIYARINSAMAMYGPYGNATAQGKTEWLKILFIQGDVILTSIKYGSTCTGLRAIQGCSAGESEKISGSMSSAFSITQGSGSASSASSSVANLLTSAVTITSGSCPATKLCDRCTDDVWAAIVGNHAVENLAAIGYGVSPLYDYIANDAWRISLMNATLDYWKMSIAEFKNLGDLVAQSSSPPLAFYPSLTNSSGACNFTTMTCANTECKSKPMCTLKAPGPLPTLTAATTFDECNAYLIATGNAAAATAAAGVGATPPPTIRPDPTTTTSPAPLLAWSLGLWIVSMFAVILGF